MYNFISKFIAPFFDPLAFALLLAACALLTWKRRRLAVGLLMVSLGSLIVCGSPVVEGALVHSLEDQYPEPGPEATSAQAIVVLGGAIQMPSGRRHASGLKDSSDRLLTAFRLYRLGKAPFIFCSGGNNPIGTAPDQVPEAVWMARLLQEWNIPATAIETEGSSINTRENALESYRVLAPRGIRRILLVTSAMHMLRAAGAFRKAHFEVIPAPAGYRTGWGQPTVLSRLLPSTYDLMLSEEALHEWLGIWVYRWRGWM